MSKYLDANGLKRALQGVASQISKTKEGILDLKGKSLGLATLDRYGNVPLDQLGNVDTTLFELVTELPTDVITTKQLSHIFIVARKTDEQTGQNKYKEYIYTGKEGNIDSTLWEEMGEFTSSVDLNDYAKKKEAISDIYFSQDTDSPASDLCLVLADGTSKTIDVPLAYGSRPAEFDPDLGTIFKPTIGKNGLMSASDKAKLDKIDVDALKASINDANTAASNTITATKGAEKVDASLEGNILTVTNRNGVKKSVNLTDSDEHITVNCTSKVEGTSMEGLALNVYVNNGKEPTQYTTDSNGQASFTIQKGATYRIVFPSVDKCFIPDPVQHIAAVGNRIIDVEYIAEVEKYEHVTIWMSKENDEGNIIPWEAVNVYMTIGGKKTTYVTDSEGKVTFDVKNGQSYTVSIDKVEGMYEQYDRYSNTRTALASSYRWKFVYRKYQSGLWLVDDENKHWTFDDWEASGNDNKKLMFICIKTLNTQRYNGDIYINIDYLANYAKIPNKQWCNQNVQFENIPLDGRNNSDTQYFKFAYNGLSATQTIMAEGDERNLETPACDYCYGLTIENSSVSYQGYLPTLEQWNVAWQNIEMVVEAVNTKYPDISVSKNNFAGSKWCSAQFSASIAYIFAAGADYNGKTGSVLAIPFFACLSTSSSLSLSTSGDEKQ